MRLSSKRSLAMALALMTAAVARSEEVRFEPILSDCAHFESIVFPAGRTATVEGEVHNGADDAASPMSGVQLELRAQDGEPTRYVLSSEDGSFLFGPLPAGSYVLRTCLSGWDVLEVPIEVDSEAPERRLELTLAPSEAGGRANVQWYEP